MNARRYNVHHETGGFFPALRAICCWLLLLAGAGCGRPTPLRPQEKAYPQPQVSGELALGGLHAPVRIVRDRWGIPHIYASDQDDLFFAQGFVQAQDRLFQLDLWRRSTQGRLAEVLGPNFIERDAMTRRMAYRGDPTAEWASYGPDTRAIADAFVRGINAQVAIARRNLPEEFVLAGWTPEFWTADDLLSRVEAFTMSGNAFSEVFRARVINAVGAAEAGTLLPLDPPVPAAIPRGLDTHDINARLADALRRIGTAPFFMSLQSAGLQTGAGTPLDSALACAVAPIFGAADIRDGSNNWAIAPSRSATGAAIVANDPHRALDHPSLRYLVHLSAPGWNVEGAVAPWSPGVAIGHNDRVAWGLTVFNADMQDLYVEHVNPANPHQVRDGARWADMTAVHDSLPVKGRSKPFTFDREYTRHGVVVAVDTQKHLAFTLRWAGSEPGTAPYFGALALDRARSAEAFRTALRHWKMPGENFAYADVDGNIGYQAAALVPIRRGWNGTLPVPGWTGEYEWRGWMPLDALPHATNPRAGYLATANNDTLDGQSRVPVAFEWGSPARINRIKQVFDASPTMDVAASRRLQTDVTAWNAERLVPLLDRVRGDRADVEEARARLRSWDRRLTTDSAAATLYVFWEKALGQQLVSAKLDRFLAREYLERVDYTLVPALTSPSAAWLGPNPEKARDALLVHALERAVDAMKQQRAATGSDLWGRLHTATFRHVLGITTAARHRFTVGPFERPGYDDTVDATYGPDLEQTGGASFREILDLARWDESIATSAPGQSESPASAHFADLATLWAKGAYFPLAFTEAAVQKNAEATLVLRPR